MSFSDEQKALALATLAACRNNTRAAARFCKEHYGFSVSHMQIHTWSKGEHVNEDCKEILTEKKAELSTLFEAEVRAAFGTLPDKRGDADYRDTVTGIAILTDKMQLLRNKPTQITDDLSALPDDALDARIAALERGEVPQAPAQTEPVSV